MLKNLKNKKKKGFTLIELIIVIAIIAILAAIAVPKFGDVKRNANLKSDVANAKTIANAASALLAEETIKASSTAIDLSSETADATAIKGYLQNVPAPKEGTKFIISTENNNVIVYMDSASVSNQVYPEPEDTTTNIWYGGTATE